MTTVAYPKYSQEPGFRIELREDKCWSPWVVLGWYPGEKSYQLHTFGPFQSKTEAIAWGKENFPRRYHVGSMRTPGDHESLLHHEALQHNALYSKVDFGVDTQ